MEKVKQSINQVQIIGTLKEMNLEEVQKEVTIGDKKVNCKQICKKEFKNPMFLVDVNGEDIGVDFFPANEKKLDEKGNLVDNEKFKALQTVLNNYVPKSKNSENPTRVKIDGSIRENGYVDQNFEWKSYPQINGFRITSTSVPENDVADCEMSGVIKNITREVRGESEEETGRLKVDFLYVDYNGAIFPMNFVVEEDLASDFEGFYEVGESVKLYYEIVVKHIGHKKTTSGGFGRRESNIVSGFSVTEYSIFRGDDHFEEENDYFISVDDVKKLLEERDIMIENKKKEKKEDENGSVKATKTKATPFGESSASKTTAKKNPFI